MGEREVLWVVGRMVGREGMREVGDGGRGIVVEKGRGVGEDEGAGTEGAVKSSGGLHWEDGRQRARSCPVVHWLPARRRHFFTKLSILVV